MEGDDREPWKCTGPCGRLMYNVEYIDGEPHPAPGAPAAKFVSNDFPRVCNLCFALYEAANERAHFRELHKKWKEAAESARKRLGSDTMNT